MSIQSFVGCDRLLLNHTSERKYGGVLGLRGTNKAIEWGVGRNNRNPPKNTLLLICEALETPLRM